MASYTTEITSPRFGKPGWQQPEDVEDAVRRLIGPEPGMRRLVDEVFTQSGRGPRRPDPVNDWFDTVTWKRVGDTDRYTLSGGIGGVEHAATLIMRDRVALGMQETEVIPDGPDNQVTLGYADDGSNIVVAEVSATSAEEELARMYRSLERLTRGNHVDV